MKNIEAGSLVGDDRFADVEIDKTPIGNAVRSWIKYIEFKYPQLHVLALVPFGENTGGEKTRQPIV